MEVNSGLIKYYHDLRTSESAYYLSRVKPLGITERVNFWEWEESGNGVPYTAPDAEGNIIFTFPSAKDRRDQTYLHKKKRRKRANGNEEFEESRHSITRTRYRPELMPLGKDGKHKRYDSPDGAPTPLLIPRGVLERVRRGDKCPVLFITEGEIKAMAGDRHGLPVVGIAGKDNFTSEGVLLEQLRVLMVKLAVQRVVLLLDSDLFDLGKVEQGGDPRKRPESFWGTVVRFRAVMLVQNVDVYLAHPVAPRAEDGTAPKLGLDDLLEKLLGPAPDMLHELESTPTLPPWGTPHDQRLAHHAERLGWRLDVCSVPLERYRDAEEFGPHALTARDVAPAAGWLKRGHRLLQQLEKMAFADGGASAHFVVKKITTTSDHQLKEWFGLGSAQQFVAKYRRDLEGWKEISWGREKYSISEKGEVELQDEVNRLKLLDKGGRLVVDSGKFRNMVSNFLFRAEYHILRPDGSDWWVLETQDLQSRRARLVLSSEEFTSVSKFKTCTTRRGLTWHGGEKELSAAVEFAIAEATEAQSLETLGLHPSGFFAWANGVTDAKGTFHPADEDGFVTMDGTLYFLRAASPLFNASDTASPEAGLRHQERPEATVSRWWSKAADVYGPHRALVGLAFVVATLSSDILRREFGFFPLLYLFGPPEMGKSTFARSLQAIWGQPTPPVMLESGSTTVTGIQRALARFRGVPTFFDEFSARSKPEFGDALKNYFDGTSGTQGVPTGDSQTRVWQVLTTAITAGQHLPAHDPALVSRCVLMEFPSRGKPNLEEKERMNALKVEERMGLTNLVNALLPLREHVARELRPASLRLFSRFLKYANEKELEVSNRVAEIHAAMAAPLAVALPRLGSFGDEESLFEAFAQLLPLHSEATDAADEAGIFFEVLQRAFDEGQLRNLGTHFLIEGKILRLRFRQAYQVFRERAARMGDKTLGEGTMRRYVRRHASFVREGKARLNNYDNPSHIMEFDLDKLEPQFGRDPNAEIPIASTF